jgi:hypothetical protein
MGECLLKSGELKVQSRKFSECHFELEYFAMQMRVNRWQRAMEALASALIAIKRTMYFNFALGFSPWQTFFADIPHYENRG